MSGDFFKVNDETRKNFSKFDPQPQTQSRYAAPTPQPANTPEPATPTKELSPVERADALITKFENELIALSDAAFVRRLHVNAIQALRSDEKGMLLLALQTFEGRKSFRNAIMKSAETGLQIDGQEACLVIYDKKHINFQPMWQGLTEIAYRSGIVKAFSKGIYKENDDFEFDMGKIVRHKVNFKSDRGKTIGYWVRATLENGETVDEFKTVQEIEKVRNASRSKNSEYSPWNNWYDEMAFKTVFRALCKALPKTEALNKVLAVWDSEFEFKNAQMESKAKTNPFLAATEKPKEQEPTLKEANATQLDNDDDVDSHVDYDTEDPSVVTNE